MHKPVDPAASHNEINQTKYIISISSAVILAVLLWVGSTVNNNQLGIAKLQAEMLGLRAELADFSTRSGEFKAETRLELRELTQRLRDVEKRK